MRTFLHSASAVLIFVLSVPIYSQEMSWEEKIKEAEESLKIAEELRSENVNVDIDLTGKGPSKNLQYANSLGIPYVLFVGKEELKQGKVKLKDMNSGKEQLMNAEELVLFLNKD